MVQRNHVGILEIFGGGEALRDLQVVVAAVCGVLEFRVMVVFVCALRSGNGIGLADPLKVVLHAAFRQEDGLRSEGSDQVGEGEPFVHTGHQMDVGASHERLGRKTGKDPLFVVAHEVVVADRPDTRFQKRQEHGSLGAQGMGGEPDAVRVYKVLLCQPLEHGPAVHHAESHIVAAFEDHLQGQLLAVIFAGLLACTGVVAGQGDHSPADIVQGHGIGVGNLPAGVEGS